MAVELPLSVLIVGAGLGGLAAALALQGDGHKVTVLESASTFGEVGAGIHLPPNSSRLLLRWGVNMVKEQTAPSRYNFTRYEDGTTIADVPFGTVAETHGAPYYLVHRADLHLALLEAAKKAGVQVQAKTRIVEYNFEEPSAKSDDGRVFRADLIVAADGVKSLARPLLTGLADKPRDTGDVAYRISLDGERLREDKDLRSLIDDPRITCWCGPEAHIIGYPVRNGELYNVVICATSHNETTEDSWVVEGNTEELLTRFAAWEPRVRKLCSMTDSFLKWRLCDLPNIPSWVHPSGKACLLGDSCHPMLPYLAQGAAQAFEDAAVLRQCLADIPGDLKAALERYQELRLPRATFVQARTREHQYIWHIEDGKEQKLRDENMRKDDDENPVFWGSKKRRNWLYSHDAGVLGRGGANWQPMEAQ